MRKRPKTKNRGNEYDVISIHEGQDFVAIRCHMCDRKHGVSCKVFALRGVNWTIGCECGFATGLGVNAVHRYRSNKKSTCDMVRVYRDFSKRTRGLGGGFRPVE